MKLFIFVRIRTSFLSRRKIYLKMKKNKIWINRTQVSKKGCKTNHEQSDRYYCETIFYFIFELLRRNENSSSHFVCVNCGDLLPSLGRMMMLFCSKFQIINLKKKQTKITVHTTGWLSDAINALSRTNNCKMSFDCMFNCCVHLLAVSPHEFEFDKFQRHDSTKKIVRLKWAKW